MAAITFDVAAFRASFPAFANATTYPTPVLQGYFTDATFFVTPDPAVGGMVGALTVEQQTRVLYLVTAHIAALAVLIAAGRTPQIKTAGSIDKISVTLMPPPVKNQWQFWLNTTPYGSQALALLNRLAVGGFYVGGLPETAGFRKVGGVF